MKKSLLVAALAACTAIPAMAQSSVTVYGRLNLTMERQKDGTGSTTNMVDNASRLGFKGTEDMGGGLKANFIIEHRFAADTGAASGTFWAGQSEVNLESSFGTVRLGSFTSDAYFATADYISMHNHDTGTSSDALYADVRGFAQSDKIGYVSPDLGGLTLYAAISGTDQEGETDRAIDLAAFYSAGAFSAGFGYQKQGDQNQFGLRGTYTAGALTVGAYYQRTNIRFIDPLDTPDDTTDDEVYDVGSRSIFRVSGMYTMGASELHVNVGRAGSYADLDDSGATQWTLGYNYNLSKRTKVYGYVTKLSVDDGIPETVQRDKSSVAVGIRHNF